MPKLNDTILCLVIIVITILSAVFLVVGIFLKRVKKTEPKIGRIMAGKKGTNLLLIMLQLGRFLSVLGLVMFLVHVLGKLVSEHKTILIVGIIIIVCDILFVPGINRPEDIIPGTILRQSRPFGLSNIYLYWHFSIVTKVNQKRNSITVISFQKELSRCNIFSSRGEIGEKEICFEEIKKGYAKVDYVNEKPLDNKTVIETAEKIFKTQMMNDQPVKYDLGTGNCENFCNYCKLGIPLSYQVDKALNSPAKFDVLYVCVALFVLFVSTCV